jgi:hypothetical protein
MKVKDSQLVTTVGDGWRTSKCSEANLKRLVDECFLQPFNQRIRLRIELDLNLLLLSFKNLKNKPSMTRVP